MNSDDVAQDEKKHRKMSRPLRKRKTNFLDLLYCGHVWSVERSLTGLSFNFTSLAYTLCIYTFSFLVCKVGVIIISLQAIGEG